MALDALRPDIELVMSRGLFSPPDNSVIELEDLTEGATDIEVDALFQLNIVDEAELAANVRRMLQRSSQVSLPEVLRRYPVTRGLAELVGYLNLAEKDDKALVDDERRDSLTLRGERGTVRKVRLPTILFTR